MPMRTWQQEDLDRIGNAEELHIQTARRDGSLRDPFPVWGVRVGNDLYIRAVRGRASPWFRGMQSRHEGRVMAGGVEKDIAFVETNEQFDEIDDAYRAKYRRYPGIVPSCVTDEARAATLRIVPRADKENAT